MMEKRGGFVPVKKPGLLYEDLLSQLESAILSAHFQPGERLIESDLAEQFGTSRGPIREALQDLERRGVVVRIPNRGTFLRSWSETEVRDFYQFRAHVEALSARLAAERRDAEHVEELHSMLRTMQTCLSEGDTLAFLDLDTDYHIRIARIARNSSLLSSIEGMRWQTRLLMALAKLTYGEPGLFQEALEYHERITQSIAGGDAAKAEREMHEHILSSGQRLEAQWSRSEESAVEGH
jgi:DNA-binding GntR family transcriptional regulator